MKIIELEQGSDEWLSWRKTVITATDCPAIMGSSPWTTAYKCWQKKLGLTPEQPSNDAMEIGLTPEQPSNDAMEIGLTPEQPSNDAMERGKRLEPIIRERFIKRYHMNMTPIVVESSEYDFLGASLDGISDCGNYILEIKTGNNNLYKMALEGTIPQYYIDQMQHQLLVTGASKCFYQVGSEDEEKDVMIEVLPDPEFKKKFITLARAFLKCLAFNEPPALQDSDYKDMSDQNAWKEFAKEYRKLNEQIKNLEDIKESYRKELLKLCGDHNCSGEGIKVMKTTIRGRVAYEEIPEIKGLNLDKYRKSPVISWKIMVS